MNHWKLISFHLRVDGLAIQRFHYNGKRRDEFHQERSSCVCSWGHQAYNILWFNVVASFLICFNVILLVLRAIFLWAFLNKFHYKIYNHDGSHGFGGAPKTFTIPLWKGIVHRTRTTTFSAGVRMDQWQFKISLSCSESRFERNSRDKHGQFFNWSHFPVGNTIHLLQCIYGFCEEVS